MRKSDIKRKVESVEKKSVEDETEGIPVRIVRNHVMEREKAERKGKEILGETDSGREDVDLVVIDRNETTVEV